MPYVKSFILQVDEDLFIRGFPQPGNSQHGFFITNIQDVLDLSHPYAKKTVCDPAGDPQILDAQGWIRSYLYNFFPGRWLNRYFDSVFMRMSTFEILCLSG